MVEQAVAPDAARPTLLMRDLARPFTLRFRDEALETDFRSTYLERSLAQVRISLLLGALIYAVFGVLDVYIIPELARSAWIVRYAVMCPAVLLAWALTFTEPGRRRLVPLQAVTAMVGGAGAVWLATRRGTLAPQLYGMGVPLLIVYALTFMRIPFTIATAAMAPVAVSSLVVLAAMGHLSLPVLLNHAFFTVSFFVAGMSASYAIEWRERASFLQERTIADRSAALQAALDNVKTLSGLLPMCAWCRKVRDDRGYWDQVEGFLARHAGTAVSHSICPECAARIAEQMSLEESAASR